MFTLSSSTLIALTTWIIVVSMPLYVQIAGGILGIVSVIVWGYGMFEGDLRRLRISLALTACLFALTLLEQIWTKTVISEFPVQFLAFNLILFNVEMIPLVTSHRRLHSGDSISRSEDLARASWKIIRRKISTLGILFSGGYVLTITTIYLGLFVYSFTPILGDTSIYLIVIFVLLALFITLREGSQIDHAHHKDLETI
ncbi:MAG TPA: hypothetical protein VMU35_04450 [Methylomirabilota bacterium]|nr:hypothetical protein [Methylomirabilota bacterium]